MKKFTGIIIAAYIPKVQIGFKSEKTFAKKATAVVLEVTAMALNERLKEQASRLCSSFEMLGIS